MHQENGQAARSGALQGLLRGVRSGFRFVCRVIGRVACMVLCIVLSVYLVHTLFSGLVMDVLGFNRAQEISDTVLKEELAAISELASYEFTYVNHVDYVDQPQLLGHNVALSDHGFSFDYCGIIKAGFDLEKISLLWIDSVEHTVGIHLPEVVILSNEISVEMDSYTDYNNICNPLEPREVLEYLYSRKEPELEKALELGLLDLAKENAMRVISLVIEGMGYSVVFVD